LRYTFKEENIDGHWYVIYFLRTEMCGTKSMLDAKLILDALNRS